MRVFFWNVAMHRPAKWRDWVPSGYEVYSFAEFVSWDAEAIAAHLAAINGQPYQHVCSGEGRQQLAAFVAQSVPLQKSLPLKEVNADGQGRDSLALLLGGRWRGFWLVVAHLRRRSARSRWMESFRLWKLFRQWGKVVAVGDFNFDVDSANNAICDYGLTLLTRGRVVQWVRPENHNIPTQSSHHRSILDLCFTRRLRAKCKTLYSDRPFEELPSDHRPISIEVM